MEYSAFELERYRCFKTKQRIEIASADGTNPGSGITYIVGENDVGKTSALEAMQFQEGDILKNSERVDGGGASFIYYDENGDPCRTLVNRAGHYILYSPDHTATQQSLPFFVPSRRYWQTRVQPNNPDRNWILSTSQRNRLRMATDVYTDMDVATLLKSIEEDYPKYEELVRAVRTIIPNFGGYAVTADDYEYVEYTCGNDCYKSSFSGDGVSSLIRIIANIISADGKMVVIDEPELSFASGCKTKTDEIFGGIF